LGAHPSASSLGEHVEHHSGIVVVPRRKHSEHAREQLEEVEAVSVDTADGRLAVEYQTDRGTTRSKDMLAFSSLCQQVEDSTAYIRQEGREMPRGDKSKYTEKQKRQAEHIEEGYEKRGVPEEEAERRAWATVNKMTGGGKKSGSGRGQKINKAPTKKGGRKGGAAAASRSFAERSASAKKAAQTRKRRAATSSS
jgi:plasmid stabilization system protein ParE